MKVKVKADSWILLELVNYSEEKQLWEENYKGYKLGNKKDVLHTAHKLFMRRKAFCGLKCVMSKTTIKKLKTTVNSTSSDAVLHLIGAEVFPSMLLF